MFSILPKEIIEIICKEVDDIKNTYEIVNPIIRTDIFEILEELCVVLRYPLDDDEEANGIHVERWINGEKRDFVFINTTNTIEKQVYTAAHELGHVWKIDEKVIAKYGKAVDSEVIINKFAAELLMPRELFKKYFIARYEEEEVDNRTNRYVLTVIVSLMNTFMVPYKAIVYRLEELGFIKEKYRIILEDIEKKFPEVIVEISKAGEFHNIFTSDKKKSMGDLYHILEEIEKRELTSFRKVDEIRKRFGYNTSILECDEDQEIQINIISEE